MRIVKSFFIALSMYSRIPVPRFEWRKEDVRYLFCFFPWIGALIGVCVYLWVGLCDAYSIGSLCRTTGAAALSLLITGGFHADGFLDTMDAIHSYQPRERKLEILKDSHIGAFAVILFILYELVYLGAFSEIGEEKALRAVCGGFFLSRCLCGHSALSFPQARKEGMLASAVGQASRKIGKAALYVQTIVCVGVMIFLSGIAGLAVSGTAVLLLFFYFYLTKKEFGGVTGDTSGYFILLCEGGMAVAAAVCSVAGIL